MKKLLVVGVVLLLLCVASWVAADRWGASELARYEITWRQRIARMREADAARRVPVLRGDAAIEGNAAPLEKALLTRVAAPSATATAALRDQSPYAPLTPEQRELVEKQRAIVDELAAAVQRTRCDWEHPYEDGVELKLPDLLSCRALANAAVLAGHERANAGDLRGAADRYLDAARFGVDVGHGVLIAGMVGAAIESIALNSLGRLVTEAPADLPSEKRVPLDEIDGALAVLEGSLPSAATSIESEALMAGGIAKLVNEKGFMQALQLASAVGSGPSPLDLVIPGRAVMAQAIPQLDECNARVAAASTITARAERAKAIEDATRPALESKNPIVAMAVPNLGVAVESLIALRSRVAVIRVAIAVEKRRLAEGGKAPAKLEEKDLPVDPSGAPARLRYEALEGGKGFRVWSVGPNGADDGGARDGSSKDDVAAERKP